MLLSAVIDVPFPSPSLCVLMTVYGDSLKTEESVKEQSEQARK